jgi:hypothetical protein
MESLLNVFPTLPTYFSSAHPGVAWPHASEQIIHGIWQHQEAEFRDELVRIFADVPDRPENRQFFSDFKEQLKSRFSTARYLDTTYRLR